MLDDSIEYGIRMTNMIASMQLSDPERETASEETDESDGEEA